MPRYEELMTVANKKKNMSGGDFTVMNQWPWEDTTFI